jgi:RNA polymerase sigma factor (sigma-70 family)
VDEREAIARLRGRDIQGLEKLVARYQTEATRIAQLITRDRALAEDVVQSAFVRVYERFEQFDASRPFAPWFFRIVSNDAIKAAQRSSRQISLTGRPGAEYLDRLQDGASGPDEILDILEQFGFGPASTNDRELTATLPATRQQPDPCLPSVGRAPVNATSLADTGFAGRTCAARWRQEYTSHVICPPQTPRNNRGFYPSNSSIPLFLDGSRETVGSS